MDNSPGKPLRQERSAMTLARRRSVCDTVAGWSPRRHCIVLFLLCLVHYAVPGMACGQDAGGDFPDFDALMKRAAGQKASGNSSAPGPPPGSASETSSTLPSAGGSSDRSRLPDEGRAGNRASGGTGVQLDSGFGGIPPASDGARNDRSINTPASSFPAEREPGSNIDDELFMRATRFDWSEHAISVADLEFPKMPGSTFPTSKAFEHSEAFLTLAEESAYLDMLAAISQQRRRLLQRTARELQNVAHGTSIWEKAFYQYENARRLAWANGHLRQPAGSDEIGGLPNPFTEPAARTSDGDQRYSLLEDIARYPDDFIGRPVVLYGRFQPASVVRIGADLAAPAAGAATVGTGDPADAETGRRAVSVLRGTVTSIKDGSKLATMDTTGLLTPQKGMLSISEWPDAGAAIPVLIKGWVVKKWDQRPLIYCETLRLISPIPHFDLIRRHTVDRQRIREEETWLYYETLRQLELTSPALQQQVAAEVLQQRIDELMKQVGQKARADVAAATALQQAGKMTESELRQRKTSLKRQLDYRVSRYRELRQQPHNFQTYVDMFEYPEVYHGHLVTLQGHVRHVVSYPADDLMFDGRMLHELWLFTDDSQHNPAVIVTPDLPSDFPREAEVVDRVTVTGCFFKRYVYGSQQNDRIAPLLLAARVDWKPTAAQVQALVADGHLSASSARAKKAAEMTAGMSRSALVMVGFVVILTLMVLWGRAQREERDRLRLRKRVNELPEFENPALPGYSLPLSDYGREYSGDVPPA
ncbi:MAG: hypothetical protein RIK87_03160 [Fuerstiella sp.]